MCLSRVKFPSIVTNSCWFNFGCGFLVLFFLKFLKTFGLFGLFSGLLFLLGVAGVSDCLQKGLGVHLWSVHLVSHWLLKH